MRTWMFSLVHLALVVFFAAGCRDGKTSTNRSNPASGAPVPREIDLSRLADADQAIDRAVAQGDIPGAVLVIGSRNGTLYRKAYGSRSLQPQREPMTADAI